jgi:hypothetical protein
LRIGTGGSSLMPANVIATHANVEMSKQKTLKAN